jgi:hypothetical protein
MEKGLHSSNSTLTWSVTASGQAFMMVIQRTDLPAVLLLIIRIVIYSAMTGSINEMMSIWQISRLRKVYQRLGYIPW